MTRVIHKFILHTFDHHAFMPHGNVRHVGFDPQGNLCLWVEVDPAEPAHAVPIYVRGTGAPVPDEPVIFIGTAAAPGQPFVWHVYGKAQP